MLHSSVECRERLFLVTAHNTPFRLWPGVHGWVEWVSWANGWVWRMSNDINLTYENKKPCRMCKHWWRSVWSFVGHCVAVSLRTGNFWKCVKTKMVHIESFFFLLSGNRFEFEGPSQLEKNRRASATVRSSTKRKETWSSYASEALGEASSHCSCSLPESGDAFSPDLGRIGVWTIRNVDSDDSADADFLINRKKQLRLDTRETTTLAEI